MSSAIFFRFTPPAAFAVILLSAVFGGGTPALSVPAFAAYCITLPSSREDGVLMKVLTASVPVCFSICVALRLSQPWLLLMLSVLLAVLSCVRLSLRLSEVKRLTGADAPATSVDLQFILLCSCMQILADAGIMHALHLGLGSALYVFVLLDVPLPALLLFRFYSGRVLPLSKRKERQLRDLSCSFSNPEEKYHIEHSRMVEIYGRVVELMEKEKPYLKENCTLSSVAAKVYSNKTYLSRSINEVAHMNFCTMMKNYRVRYAMEIMLQTPDVRITELATRSGFHNVVSFSSAFKEYYGITAAEYLQKLRLVGLPSMKQEEER